MALGVVVADQHGMVPADRQSGVGAVAPPPDGLAEPNPASRRRRRARVEFLALLAQYMTFAGQQMDLPPVHPGRAGLRLIERRSVDLHLRLFHQIPRVRRLKGENRPLIGEDERAHILSALDCVDYVVLFDEDTPQTLIETLRPSVLVKGGDYTPDRVVGKDIVESYGGRVELVDFVDGKSTTNIIEKVLKIYGAASDE